MMHIKKNLIFKKNYIIPFLFLCVIKKNIVNSLKLFNKANLVMKHFFNFEINNMKYKKIISLFTVAYLFNLSLPTIIHTNDYFDLDTLSQNLDDIDRTQLRACEEGEAGVWVGFLDMLKIPELFNDEFYKSTALPAYRNVINFPNFFIFSYQDPTKEQMTFHLFWNQTNKRHYVKDEVKNCSKRCTNHTEDGKRLGSYLDIEGGTFLNILNDDLKLAASLVPDEIDVIKNINFPSIFHILANAQLQERRLGTMLHYFKQMNDSVTFEAKLPLFWQIRNLNYTEKEKEQLRTEFGKFYAAASGESNTVTFDEVQFGKDHLVMDAFGPGTLDLTVKKRVYEKGNKQVHVGASLYLPTDGHIKRGLYGTYFDPCDQQPILRICDLVNINALGNPNDDVLSADARSIMEKYFLGAIDHLSSALLQCPMGYNKHLAFAAQVLPYWQISDRLEYSGTWIFEYIAPKSHPRFFVKKQPSTKFSDQFAALAGDDAAQLDLIERRLTERLYPRVYMTRVSPGFLFNTVANFQFHHKEWDFTLGYNWWYRSKEKLSHIQIPYADLQELDICKATTQSSTQVKLFGKIHKNIVSSYHHHNVSLSLYGNATIYNDNHGHDFTIGLSFDKVF